MQREELLAQRYRAICTLYSRAGEGMMAESEGFEPPIALRLCLISSQVHSTGLCQLSVPLVYLEFEVRHSIVGGGVFGERRVDSRS